jgi:hypothetical protein
MPIRRYFLWGAALGLLSGALALLMRPARLEAARVTGVQSSDPPVANVSVRYGSGTPPESVIVDLYSNAGAAGSATIDGRQQTVEVPIAGAPGHIYRVTTTASYRLFGVLRTSVREFND